MITGTVDRQLLLTSLLDFQEYGFVKAMFLSWFIVSLQNEMVNVLPVQIKHYQCLMTHGKYSLKSLLADEAIILSGIRKNCRLIIFRPSTLTMDALQI